MIFKKQNLLKITKNCFIEFQVNTVVTSDIEDDVASDGDIANDDSDADDLEAQLKQMQEQMRLMQEKLKQKKKRETTTTVIQ